MAVEINGRTYWYVDTVCVDEVVYDIYQDEYDNVVYKAIDTLDQSIKKHGLLVALITKFFIIQKEIKDLYEKHYIQKFNKR